jgi:hypothetical protein
MANADYVPIPEFYKNRSLFITGGTGFMGKVGVGVAAGILGATLCRVSAPVLLRNPT